MPQKEVWENEYRQSKLVTKKDEPQADFKRFWRWLTKEQGVRSSGLKILDLGCGTGRHSNWLATIGNDVVGMDISVTALALARKRGHKLKNATYLEQSIADRYPFPDNHFDLILDITSSNSLSDSERLKYLEEISRVLKSNGFLYLRTLCKEGDSNAKKLLRDHPGPEPDTYVMPELGLVEKVFDRETLTDLYSAKFKILKLTKKTSYTRLNNRSYKRNFWLGYLSSR